MFEIRRPLVICIAAISASAVSHKPWRVVHKGSADLSTGLNIREDDDLVVNTPMPIVLRRTYNSGDAHSRQFGLDATHPQNISFDYDDPIGSCARTTRHTARWCTRTTNADDSFALRAVTASSAAMNTTTVAA